MKTLPMELPIPEGENFYFSLVITDRDGHAYSAHSQLSPLDLALPYADFSPRFLQPALAAVKNRISPAPPRGEQQ